MTSAAGTYRMKIEVPTPTYRWRMYVAPYFTGVVSFIVSAVVLYLMDPTVPISIYIWGFLFALFVAHPLGLFLGQESSPRDALSLVLTDSTVAGPKGRVARRVVIPLDELMTVRIRQRWVGIRSASISLYSSTGNRIKIDPTFYPSGPLAQLIREVQAIAEANRTRAATVA